MLGPISPAQAEVLAQNAKMQVFDGNFGLAPLEQVRAAAIARYHEVLQMTLVQADVIPPPAAVSDTQALQSPEPLRPPVDICVDAAAIGRISVRLAS